MIRMLAIAALFVTTTNAYARNILPDDQLIPVDQNRIDQLMNSQQVKEKLGKFTVASIHPESVKRFSSIVTTVVVNLTNTDSSDQRNCQMFIMESRMINSGAVVATEVTDAVCDPLTRGKYDLK